jgi:hypothetical protein
LNWVDLGKLAVIFSIKNLRKVGTGGQIHLKTLVFGHGRLQLSSTRARSGGWAVSGKVCASRELIPHEVLLARGSGCAAAGAHDGWRARQAVPAGLAAVCIEMCIVRGSWSTAAPHMLTLVRVFGGGVESLDRPAEHVAGRGEGGKVVLFARLCARADAGGHSAGEKREIRLAWRAWRLVRPCREFGPVFDP